MIFDGNHSTTLEVEGVNPTDPQSTEVQIQVDPNGTGDWVVLDKARFTVGGVQLVYTDVSGLSHDTGEPEGILDVPRIASDLQPEGKTRGVNATHFTFLTFLRV